MPSMMAARWVGQNSGPIFTACGPKYTELSLPVRERPQFATLFSNVLLRSGVIHDQVKKLCEISPIF